MAAIRKVPPVYAADFAQAQTALIKTRVRLFCAMALGLYFAISITSALTAPEEFRPQEVPVSAALLAGGIAVLYLAGRARTLRGAKLNAYLFTVLILLVITKICAIYHEYAPFSATIYTIILFLVAFIIPWLPSEILLIAALNIAAYTLFFLYVVRFVPLYAAGGLGMRTYSDGLTLILTAFVIAFIIRRNEAARDIENFVLMKELRTANETMQRELDLATQVHKTLVPRSISTDLVDIAALYLPAYYLGGDYARFHFIDRERLIFIIADVTGHGVPAALLVNRLHAEFESQAKKDKGPGLLLKELNDFIIDDFEGTNMYLSAFCGLLDFTTMKFTYSNHGHPTQYLYRVRESKIIRFASQASLLGFSFGGGEEACQQEVAFMKGDRIMLFTDGVTEAMDRKHEEYGRERLEEFIARHHSLTSDAFNRRLLEELNSFTRQAFHDDIFLLTLEMK